MRIKTFKFFIFLFLLLIPLIYFFKISQPFYRNDCDKDLNGFDILFVYFKGCSHCKEDVKRMKKLGIENKFYMIDVASEKCRKIIEMYADYIIYHKNSNFPNAPVGILTPTKVCLYNNKTFIGEMNLNEMEKFYKECISEKK